MKKIIALALAFVMAFAVAATAMAAVGVTVIDLPSTPDIGITVEKLKKAEDAAGLPIWTAMGATEGIKPNKEYGVKITVTVPKNYSYDVPTWLNVTFSGVATAAAEGITVPTVVANAGPKTAVVEDSAAWFGFGSAAGDETIFPAPFDATDKLLTSAGNPFPAKNDTSAALKFVTVISFFSTEDTEDEVETNDANKITVRVGLTDAGYGRDLSEAGFWATNTGFNVVVGGKDYLIFKSAVAPGTFPASVTPALWYGITNKAGTEGIYLACSEARTDGYAKVGAVYVVSNATGLTGTAWKAYATTVGGELAFEDGPIDIVKGDTNFDALKTILDKYLGVMGWSFAGSLGWVKDADFTKLSGYTGEKVVTATFAPYILTLTVSGPATVPDTGDNSVVGIVMVAVAILTCAAVAIRKVRA